MGPWDGSAGKGLRPSLTTWVSSRDQYGRSRKTTPANCLLAAIQTPQHMHAHTEINQIKKFLIKNKNKRRRSKVWWHMPVSPAEAGTLLKAFAWSAQGVPGQPQLHTHTHTHTRALSVSSHAMLCDASQLSARSSPWPDIVTNACNFRHLSTWG